MDIADAADIKSGFTITFRFGEGNRLFANQELRKEYFFTEDGRLTINGTHVEWIQASVAFARCCKGSELRWLTFALCSATLLYHSRPSFWGGQRRRRTKRRCDPLVLKKQEPLALAQPMHNAVSSHAVGLRGQLV